MTAHTYLFPLNVTAWCLVDDVAVNSCTPKQVDIVETVDGTTVIYTVVSHDKTYKKNETELYATLNGALLALADLLD